MELQLICDICKEQIGRFDPEDIKLPLKGSMFKPIDDIHGYPPPFEADVTWEFMHCIRDGHSDPQQRHRPISDPKRILTNEGFFVVGNRPPGPVEHHVHVYDDQDLEKEWNERLKAKEPGPETIMVKTGTKPKPSKSANKRVRAQRKPRAKKKDNIKWA